MEACVFCNQERDLYTLLENGSCLFLSGKDFVPEGVLMGSGIIIPKEHRESPFDLTQQEIHDTFALLRDVKTLIDNDYHPDGYNLGWNIGEVGGQDIFHAHFHVLPRYSDEPLAGKGIRYFLKQSSNKRRTHIPTSE